MLGLCIIAVDLVLSQISLSLSYGDEDDDDTVGSAGRSIQEVVSTPPEIYI